MTLLKSIAGISSSSTYGVGNEHDQEINDAIGATALADATIISHKIDCCHEALNDLLDVSEIVEALKPSTKTERKLARIYFADKLQHFNDDLDETISLTASLESEYSDVGTEAFDTIKDAVRRAIEWVQEQWKKFKRFIMKYWNKYFGDIERLKRGWESLQKKVKTREDGYELKKGEKVELTNLADYHYDGEGALVTSNVDRVKGIENFRLLSQAIVDGVLDQEIKEVEPNDLKSAAKFNTAKGREHELDDAQNNTMKTSIENAYGNSHTKIFNALETGGLKIDFGRTENFTGLKRFDGSINIIHANAKNTKFLGRQEIYAVKAKEDAEDNYSIFNPYRGFKLAFGELSDTQKPKDKVSLSPATTNDIDSLCTANIELLESLMGIRRNGLTEKSQDRLDKASKNLSKWSKDTPDKEEGEGARGVYRAGVRGVTAYFDMMRILLVNFPIELCNKARQASVAQKVFAEKSLALYKKS